MCSIPEYDSRVIFETTEDSSDKYWSSFGHNNKGLSKHPFGTQYLAHLLA
jgi:hypothetical protein